MSPACILPCGIQAGDREAGYKRETAGAGYKRETDSESKVGRETVRLTKTARKGELEIIKGLGGKPRVFLVFSVFVLFCCGCF